MTIGPVQLLVIGFADPDFHGQIRAELEKRAHEAAGQEFNVASPKQLEAILFDALGLKSTRKTKTGRSTDAEVLEALSDDHSLPGVILEHRVTAEILETRPTYAMARVLDIVDASTHRVVPPCPEVARGCGACVVGIAGSRRLDRMM